MKDKLMMVIEDYQALSRIDNRLIGNLEEQVKQITKLWKDELKINDVLLEKVIAGSKPKVVYETKHIEDDRLVLELRAEVESLQAKLIDANNDLMKVNRYV